MGRLLKLKSDEDWSEWTCVLPCTVSVAAMLAGCRYFGGRSCVRKRTTTGWTNTESVRTPFVRSAHLYDSPPRTLPALADQADNSR